MDEIAIRPNSKNTIENITIACYGKGMIMVNHPVLPAPKPIGPTDEDEFWEQSDEHRLEAVLDFTNQIIDWEESDPDIAAHLGSDIAAAREKIEKNE